MKLSIFPLVLLGVFLNTIAQLALKAGVTRVDAFGGFTWANIFSLGMQVFANPWVITSLLCYGISVLIWMLVLAKIPVSIAYPMISLGYIFNAIAAHYWLNEDMNFLRIAGIIIILIGVVLISRS